MLYIAHFIYFIIILTYRCCISWWKLAALAIIYCFLNVNMFNISIYMYVNCIFIYIINF